MTTTLQAITNVRHEAEAMLKQHVADNPTADAVLLDDLLTPDQRHLLTMAGFTTTPQVQMEVGRARVVADLKAKAGTCKQRKAAEKAAADAAKMLRTESAEIKRAIADAQAKLTVLDREARDTAAKRDDMLMAVDHLRSDRFLPKHVVEQAAYARRRVKATGDAETLRELDSKLSTLKAPGEINDAIQAAREKDDKGYAVGQACETRIRFAQMHAPDTLIKRVTGNMTEYSLNDQAWAEYVATCNREFGKLKPQAEKLREKVDAELHLCEGCRDLYVAEIG
jgi:hypothetical protein